MENNETTPKKIKIIDALEGFRYDNSFGDTWINAWAGDGNIYSVADDTSGFDNACDSNLAFNRLEGDDPYNLKCTTINPMNEYGMAGELWGDGCCWKADGMTCVDGVMYVGVSRHRYGTKDFGNHQTAENASIIKSTDYGLTWTRSARENYEKPMFLGRNFGAPFFVKYGKDGTGKAHNADQYVYAVSNNGYWDNGDRMVLARVPRTRIADMERKDWEFYRGNGKDGMLDSSWTVKDYAATPIISSPERCGMTGIQYLEGLDRYVMLQWCYPELQMGNGSYTEWDIYFSSTPWGPWEKTCTKVFKGPGYYNPDVCGKFTRADGKKLILFTSGKAGSTEHYKLVIMPYTLLVEEV